jgi:hypothetical protein
VEKQDKRFRLAEAKLPFAKKLSILDELRERARILREAKLKRK